MKKIVPGNYIQFNLDHKMNPSWDFWEIRGVIDNEMVVVRRGRCYRSHRYSRLMRAYGSGGIDILTRVEYLEKTKGEC